MTNFCAGKPPPKTPQLTTQAPQLHHKKPSKKTHISRDPLKNSSKKRPQSTRAARK
jgi:hypothetical protein